MNSVSARFLVGCLLFLLTSCAILPTPVPPTLPPTLSPTATTTPFQFPPTFTPDPRGTRTPAPAAEATAPVITATATLSGPTPTFDAASAATLRPASPALCPPRVSTIQADQAGWDALMAERQTVELLEAIQFYLNQGGAFRTAAAALDEYRDQGGLSFFLETDLTHDGINELLAVDRQAYVFWCAAGFMDLQTFPDDPPAEFPEVLFVGDMNLTGVPEIVLYWGDDCNGESCGMLAVLEWDAGEFHNLVFDKGGHLATMDAAFDTRFADLEGNGTIEILLSGGIPVETSTRYRDGLPWRERFDTYMWNGENFVLASYSFSTPVYRFQAVQDGDRQTLQGEYEDAVLSYQNAIFHVALDWWSPERAAYLRAVWDSELGAGGEVPPPPGQDAAEADFLAAYARFRLMLLYLLRGWEGDAVTVYESLVLVYPDGKDGSVFAAMADAFMEVYQETGRIGTACTAAVAVAEENPQALAFLGAAHHGTQSKVYGPGDVCPFQD